MPPLESTLPITAPGQHWLGTKNTNSSNLRNDHPSKVNTTRRVTFSSEEDGSGNNHGSERREWDHPQDEDDDVSTLTDVFPGYDIEAPKRLLQKLEEEESEGDDEEERQHQTKDSVNDDTSLEKMLEEGYDPSADCMSPLAEVREVFPAYNQACEEVVLQVGDFVHAVKHCTPCTYARQDISNTGNNAPSEQAGLFASLWDQARRFLDPPTPPPIPTVLSSENTMEIYPDSSVSFAEGETLAVVPAANIPQENETVGYNPEQPGLSQRGLLDNVKDRSSDEAPPDGAEITRPAPADQNKKPLERTALFDPSETSHASVSTTEADIPRPYGESRRRSRCFIVFLLVLAVCTLFGIGFGAAGKKEHQQIEEKLMTRDPSSTLSPTLSPSQYMNETSTGTTTPTTNSTSRPTSPTVAPSEIESPTPTLAPTKPPTVAPSEIASPTPTLAPTKPPTVAPSEIASPTPTFVPTAYPTVAPIPLPTPTPTLSLVEAPASTPTRAPTTSPTDPITTTMPTLDPIEAARMRLPYYPVFRFVPWNDVTVSLRLLLQQLLGYNEENWNLPGSINNNGHDYSRFWEAQSYTTIQNTASIEVLSAVISMGFGRNEWDCWINHYQNFTWAELETLSHINAGSNSLNVTGSKIQMAMTTFGWTESNWSTVERLHYFFPTTEEGLGARSPWNNLTLKEQAAATRLCYTQELWDRVPLN